MKRYTCPKCKAQYHEEPAECPVCGWIVLEDGPMLERATKPLYQELAQLVAARLHCIGNERDRVAKHEQRIMNLVSEYMPSGSGFDAGTLLDWELSSGNKLVFITSYHHMNDAGFYDGWTEHRVIVKPDLQFDFTLRITGRDRNKFKEYAYEVFDYALRGEV